MTSEEAIDLLDNLNGMIEDSRNSDYDTAFKMAIKALEQEPCDDAVSRDLMTNTLGATCIAKRDEKGDLVALCSIDHLPSAALKPRTGHWIHIGDKDFGFRDIVICKCSECGGVESFTGKFELEGCRLVIDMDRVYKFCPNCGAKMAESEEDKK